MHTPSHARTRHTASFGTSDTHTHAAAPRSSSRMPARPPPPPLGLARLPDDRASSGDGAPPVAEAPLVTAPSLVMTPTGDGAPPVPDPLRWRPPPAAAPSSDGVPPVPASPPATEPPLVTAPFSDGFMVVYHFSILPDLKNSNIILPDLLL